MVVPPISNGTLSPSGNNGQSASANQCPGGPSGITVNYDTQSLQCYYALPSGGSCTAPYQQQSGTTWCVATSQFSCPSVIGATPTPQGAVCTYPLANGQNCAPGYGAIAGNQCASNTNFYSGPTPGCPSLSTLQNGQCTMANGAPVGFTCPTGYIYITSGCDANPIAFLIDQSNTCTGLSFSSSSSTSTSSSSSSVSSPSYTCMYGSGVTLTCNIANSSDACTMRRPSLNGTVIGNYACSGIDPNTGDFTGSGGCNYYGVNPIGPPPPSSPLTVLASSTCQFTGTGSSVDCQIAACFNTRSILSTGTYTFIPCPSGSQAPTPNVIEVNIDQNCTQVVNGQPLICTYGTGSNTGTTTKTESIQINCIQQLPNLNCTATDPYERAINKSCGGDGSTCDITDNNSTASPPPILWVEKCTPGSSIYQTCPISDQTGNNQFGIISCSNNTTCTITDGSHNTITLNCTSPSYGTTCTSSTPDCPHTDPVPSGPKPAAVAITASTMACDASVLADVFMGNDANLIAANFGNDSGKSEPELTLTFPLSQAELEFMLTKLGIGSQTWPSAPIIPNLPAVTYLSLRR